VAERFLPYFKTKRGRIRNGKQNAKRKTGSIRDESESGVEKEEMRC
jgi:hypothetical protein